VTATELNRGTATSSVLTLAASCYPGLSDALKAGRTGAGGKKRRKRSQFTLYFQHRWENQSPWARRRDARGASNRADRSAFRAVSARRAGFDGPRSPGAETAPERKTLWGRLVETRQTNPIIPCIFNNRVGTRTGT
jgi:hypothetical protein